MKIPGVGPDIEQALAHFFKLTFLHNAYPIVLVFLICLTLILALHKPSRPKILFLLGCALLLLHFEYVKHIADALKQQTLVTVNTEVPNYRFLWITEKFISRIIPFSLLFGGWGSVIISLGLHFQQLQKTHGHTKHQKQN